MGDIFLYTQQNTLEPKLLITAAAPQNISTVPTVHDRPP